jgi:predicted ATPase
MTPWEQRTLPGRAIYWSGEASRLAITRIKVSNFKSFNELELDLRSLSVVVGANAAGKSNFLEIFRFLRDLAEHGPENAVSLQGGVEYLANLKREQDSISVIAFEMVQHSQFGLPEPEFLPMESRVQIGDDGDVSLLSVLPSGIRIFDFDPGLAKRAMPLSGKAELEADGSNLALVLRRLLQDEKRRPMFLRTLKDVLPFIEDLKVEHIADRSLLLALREQYFQGSYLPAAFLSDGTVHLIALILALFFERGEIVVIEEPERNIHPALISKVAGMLKDASRHKQVIVTTHNPELVKHVDLEDLLLVHRDEEGFSRITRPAESAELKVFLENDLGVDELYVQNLLGAGNAV